MTRLYSVEQVRERIAASPDELAGAIFEPGSFARETYDEATQAHLARAERSDVDREEAARWKLTPEQWTSQVAAVKLAREHDAKLDMIKQGIGRV